MTGISGCAWMILHIIFSDSVLLLFVLVKSNHALSKRSIGSVLFHISLAVSLCVEVSFIFRDIVIFMWAFMILYEDAKVTGERTLIAVLCAGLMCDSADLTWTECW